VAPRKKLRATDLPAVRRSTAEELQVIRRIALRAGHPYNFGPAPNPKTHTSLEEFIQSWESTHPFAVADVVDKWNLESLNAETFDRFIDRTKVFVPGYLSAVTTAKVIAYCLLIIEAEHEALQAYWLTTLQFVRPDAQDVVNSLAARARAARPESNLDHSRQFADAVKNPVVEAGVNNAAVNRWGLSDKNRRKIAKAQAEKARA
jgi:hypothetical protein